ncbi:MAG: hypothetical protein Ct9H300mP7_3590 [Verrucomicrobiota bacterium]|nr:MAG: hypothetical protein Ct9H300mP7_3590 [Verrucomicrobiota bacterium]
MSITTDTAMPRFAIPWTVPTDQEPGQIYTGPIKISGTTMSLPWAPRPGFKPTNIDTHTYLFPRML